MLRYRLRHSSFCCQNCQKYSGRIACVGRVMGDGNGVQLLGIVADEMLEVELCMGTTDMHILNDSFWRVHNKEIKLCL